jgi:hypothetical protein
MSDSMEIDQGTHAAPAAVLPVVVMVAPPATAGPSTRRDV